jgi:hypothetical protein
VPDVLLELYADPDLLETPPFVVVSPDGNEEWDIDEFEPADAEAMDVDHFGIPETAFCFATSGFGDPYYVEFPSVGDDGPVYRLNHDGGDIDRVAGSLREFLNWPRRPGR